jgi:hypothetical protein
MSKPISPFLNKFKNTELARPCNYEVEIYPSKSFVDLLSNSTSFSADFNALFGEDETKSLAINQYKKIKAESYQTASYYTQLGNQMQKKIGEYGSGYFNFKCEAAALPGRTFSLIEQKTYGPVQRHPIANFYSDVKLTFICSDNMFEKIFFDSWFECMSVSNIDAISGSAIELIHKSNSVKTGLGVRFDFAYKDEYTCNIRIKQYDVTGSEEKTYIMTLLDAFPYSIDTMPLSWRGTDSYHRISVSFTYRYYETNKPLTSFFNNSIT